MKTIVFDFDGVILNSFDTVLRCLRSLHEQYQLPTLNREKLEELFDGNLWENHARLGLTETEEHQLKEDLKILLAHTQDTMSLVPEMGEVLETLAQHYTLIIVSSNHAENIGTRLKKEGLAQNFTSILGAENPGNKMEKIRHIIASTSEEIFFVTDTRGDVLEMQGLAIHTIAVSWGYHSPERLALAKPEITLHSPKELQNYFIA